MKKDFLEMAKSFLVMYGRTEILKEKNDENANIFKYEKEIIERCNLYITNKALVAALATIMQSCDENKLNPNLFEIINKLKNGNPQEVMNDFLAENI